MKKFRFSLERVRSLTETRLQIAEAIHDAAVDDLRRAERAYEQGLDAGRQLERSTLAQSVLTALELSHLDALHDHRKREAVRIDGVRVRARDKIAQLRAGVLHWKRKLELLDRLRERQKSEWTREQDRELQITADESYQQKLMAEARLLAIENELDVLSSES